MTLSSKSKSKKSESTAPPVLTSENAAVVTMAVESNKKSHLRAPPSNTSDKSKGKTLKAKKNPASGSNRLYNVMMAIDCTPWTGRNVTAKVVRKYRQPSTELSIPSLMLFFLTCDLMFILMVTLVHTQMAINDGNMNSYNVTKCKEAKPTKQTIVSSTNEKNSEEKELCDMLKLLENNPNSLFDKEHLNHIKSPTYHFVMIGTLSVSLILWIATLVCYVIIRRCPMMLMWYMIRNMVFVLFFAGMAVWSAVTMIGYMRIAETAMCLVSVGLYCMGVLIAFIAFKHFVATVAEGFEIENFSSFSITWAFAATSLTLNIFMAFNIASYAQHVLEHRSYKNIYVNIIIWAMPLSVTVGLGLPVAVIIVMALKSLKRHMLFVSLLLTFISFSAMLAVAVVEFVNVEIALGTAYLVLSFFYLFGIYNIRITQFVKHIAENHDKYEILLNPRRKIEKELMNAERAGKINETNQAINSTSCHSQYKGKEVKSTRSMRKPSSKKSNSIRVSSEKHQSASKEKTTEVSKKSEKEKSNGKQQKPLEKTQDAQTILKVQQPTGTATKNLKDSPSTDKNRDDITQMPSLSNIL